MFNLDSSPCYGELVFMERYQEAVREMARVEHNIENQASDGTGGIRRSGSGRSTLQAIGNAAAAGKDHGGFFVVFFWLVFVLSTSKKMSEEWKTGESN